MENKKNRDTMSEDRESIKRMRRNTVISITLQESMRSLRIPIPQHLLILRSSLRTYNRIVRNYYRAYRPLFSYTKMKITILSITNCHCGYLCIRPETNPRIRRDPLTSIIGLPTASLWPIKFENTIAKTKTTVFVL